MHMANAVINFSIRLKRKLCSQSIVYESLCYKVFEFILVVIYPDL